MRDQVHAAERHDDNGNIRMAVAGAADTRVIVGADSDDAVSVLVGEVLAEGSNLVGEGGVTVEGVERDWGGVCAMHQTKKRFSPWHFAFDPAV